MNTKVQSRISLDYTGMMKSDLNPQGWTVEQLKSHEPQIQRAQHQLRIKRETGVLDFSRLLMKTRENLDDLLKYADWAAQRFSAFVVLGIGGSALGPSAVQQALNPYYYNELSKEKRGNRPRIYILDNIDPERFQNLISILDLPNTLFNVISKSGQTSETLAQFMIIRELLQKISGDQYRQNIVVTTEENRGDLWKIAEKEGFQRFVIPEGIGGRFSELTSVGLLPAAVSGIDIRAMLSGAIEMDHRIRSEQDLLQNPAQLRALWAFLAWQERKNISVFMPYADGLKTMADWYAQLWSESLGKRFNQQGEEVYVGQTPVKSLGVTDQHSQLQLYMEGPNDKIITFLLIEEAQSDLRIPEDAQLPESMTFLCGHTLGEMLKMEEKATEYALTLAGRQHQCIYLPKLEAFHIGELLLLLEWETAYMGELLNVNAYDQPGVEETKIGTFALMNRPEYSKRKCEIEHYATVRYRIR